MYIAIMTVALDRLATGLPDGVLKCRNSLLLRSGCARHVEDFFLQNRAVQIVHTVAERDLRERQSQADPVSGKVIDIIQINAAHRQIAKLFKCRHAFYVSKNCRLRLESERNEACKSAGLIL